MNNGLMFSSKSGNWDTPQDLIDDLATVFDWDLDVCASRPNVCENYYDESVNGLEQKWLSLNWCNPPYGRGIGDWYLKAQLQNYYFSCATVMLVPSRTDTKYWHEFVPMASQVVFIKGRLKFGGAKNSAPFPSAFVIFGDITQGQRDKLSSYGISYLNEAQS